MKIYWKSSSLYLKIWKATELEPEFEILGIENFTNRLGVENSGNSSSLLKELSSERDDAITKA